MNPSPPPSLMERGGLTLISLACVAGLIFCATLKPDPRGFGTHESFSTPCHFRVVTGLPCPSCGITTSFSLLCKGRLWQGFQAQPFGALLFVLCLLIPFLTLRMWISRRSVLYPLQRKKGALFLILFGAFICSWLWKLLTSL